jgi:acetoin:2,6-dichlorophenolindophenol oxidoreductase subunit beta
MKREILFKEALQEAVREEMARDKDVIYLGIDVRVGAVGLSTGLVDTFGKERVVNTPIAESTVAGMGIGAAVMGLRPIAEIMFEDFALLAMDHIYNNMGTWHYLTNGQYKVPLTVITSSGTGAGMGSGHGHGQALQPLFMSSPGITICVPATPYDGKGLLKSAIRSDNPVLYSIDAICLNTIRGEVPEGDYTIPFGKASIAREGKDATVVALGKMVHHALKSAAELEKEGIDVEVIDPRTIVPLDTEAILTSVAKTGRLVVAEESRITNGFGSEVLAIVASEDPSMLKAPARRVAAPMIPIPAACALEDLYLPNKDDITKAVKELIGR